jgi:hypothetical protein
MRLRHRNEVPGTEEPPDRDLMLQCPTRHGTEFTGQDRLLFVVELHHLYDSTSTKVLCGRAPLGQLGTMKLCKCAASQAGGDNA